MTFKTLKLNAFQVSRSMHEMDTILQKMSRFAFLSDSVDRVIEIRKNQHSGRGLISKIDWSENELVLWEEPLVVGPAIDPTSKFCCVMCCKVLDPKAFNRCKLCDLPVCPEMCRNQSIKKWHMKQECPLLAKSRPTISLELFFSTRCWLLPLRALILKFTDKLKWDQFLQLEHHLEERKNCPILQKQQAVVWMAVQELALVGDVSQDEIRQTCSIFDSNAFRIGESREVRALFALVSLVNHDCRPNTRIVFNAQFNGSLLTRRTIRSGEELTITYVSPLQNTKERRDKLLRSKHFMCKCSRCEDSSEFGTHFSSLRCPKCIKGNIADNDLFACNNCSFKTTKEKVQHLMTALSLKREKALKKMDSTSLESVLGIHLKVLSDNHSFVIELKQKLLQALNRENDLQSWKRQIQLNQEVIDLLERIDGSISRQMGFLQYQRQSLFVMKLAHMQRVERACQKDVQEMVECGKTDWLIRELEKSLMIAVKILKNDINCPEELKRIHVK